MTNRSLLSIGIKLMAFYLFAGLLYSLPIVLMPRSDISAATWWQGIGWGLLLIVPYAVIGTLLLRGSYRIAASLLPEEEPRTTLVIKPMDLQVVAFSVLGLSFIVNSSIRVFGLGISLATSYFSEPERFQGYNVNRELRSTLQMFAGYLLQVGLGILIFIGARGISRLWRRLSKWEGFPREPPHPDPDSV